MLLFHEKLIVLTIIDILSFLIDSLYIFFRLPNKHNFLKQCYYEIGMIKVLFLAAHNIYFSNFFCVVKGFKMHSDKNYLNFLNFFYIMVCFYVMQNWLSLWSFVFCHFKLADIIIFFQMTKWVCFLKITLLWNGNNKVLFLAVHNIYLSNSLSMLQYFQLHFDENCLNYLLFFYVIVQFYFM